jgi:hypothetical protein
MTLFRDFGKMIHEKNLMQKNLVTLALLTMVIANHERVWIPGWVGGGAVPPRACFSSFQ